ncbi:MAG: hypothetical protein HYW62_02275 [Candidatus Levybacteria bacterium]|nr:hypothetical protein [Candidatus Levybacteria bacterium]
MIQNFLLDQFRILRNNYFRLRLRASHSRLAEIKAYQRKQFDKLSITFSKKYYRLNSLDISKFTTPLWRKFNSQIEKSLLPIPSFSFLNDPTVMVSMFATAGGGWLKKELKFLQEKMDKKVLKKVLEEDYAGEPLLLNSYYLTSHTVIHHLHHLIKFTERTKTKLENLNTIVEWGGGYGSLIRILKKINQKKTTYISIDTPLFVCLQWLYLSTIFGEKEINLLLGPKDKIKNNKINLLPLPFLENHEINADLFISTWALSESSKYSQDYVLKKNWFNAKHLLLAYQDNPSGLFNPSRIGKLAKDKGAIIEDMEFLPGNHYAFL